MSETKFTPGPWTFSHDHPTTQTIAHVYAPGEHEISDEICTLYGCENVPSFNAALIAAAPELYEALEELLRYANDSDDCQYGTLSTRLVKDIAEAALAKARGEA